MTDYERMQELLKDFSCRFKKFPIIKAPLGEIAGYSLEINEENIITYGTVGINFDIEGNFTGFESGE